MALTQPREGAYGDGNGPRSAGILRQGFARCSCHAGPECRVHGLCLYRTLLSCASHTFYLFIFYCFTNGRQEPPPAKKMTTTLLRESLYWNQTIFVMYPCTCV